MLSGQDGTQGIHLKYMPQWPWVATMTPGAAELHHDHSSYELFCPLLRVSIAKRKKKMTLLPTSSPQTHLYEPNLLFTFIDCIPTPILQVRKQRSKGVL